MAKSQSTPLIERRVERRAASGTQRAARSDPRRSLAVEVQLEREGAVTFASARNISLGGMFLETSAPAPFGSAIVVALDLGLGAPTRVRAIVRWTSGEGMGVQFDVMGARETHALTDLLRQQAEV